MAFTIWFFMATIFGFSVGEDWHSVYMFFLCVIPPATCLICAALFTFWKRKAPFAFVICSILMVFIIFLIICLLFVFNLGVTILNSVTFHFYVDLQFKEGKTKF